MATLDDSIARTALKCFSVRGYPGVSGITSFLLYQYITKMDALKGSKEHRMRKDQCFEPYYYSFISLAVKDSSGKLVGNEDDGYLIENIHSWHVSKSLFSKKKGYIIDLSTFEIK